MSYDTTVNEALDPPAARVATRGSNHAAARRWWACAIVALCAVATLALAWIF